MMNFRLFVVVSLIVCVHLFPGVNSICSRHRKPWQLLSDTDRKIFAEAFRELNTNGVLETLSATHKDTTDFEQAHLTSAFLPWHRYIVYEAESQIRKLGGKFECFAMPWWDFSYEKGRSTTPFILDSQIGGDGSGPDLCITGDGWDTLSYPTTHMCTQDEAVTSLNCCVKREALLGEESEVASYAQMAATLMEYSNFGSRVTGLGFNPSFQLGYHTNSHAFIAGGLSHIDKMLTTRYAPTDPIFYLIHSWTDYVWSLWFTCNGYDQVPLASIKNHHNIYQVSTEDRSGPSSELDALLLFTRTSEKGWSEYSAMQPTVLKMMDWTVFDITYERGNFFDNSHIADLCPSDIATRMFPEKDEKSSAAAAQVFDEELSVHENKNRIHLFEQGLYSHLTSESMQYSKLDVVQSWASHSCKYSRSLAAVTGDVYDEEEADCLQDEEPEEAPERCDMKFQGAENNDAISLDDVLNRRGVVDNKCLRRFRSNRYQFMKNFGKLWKLCDGQVDQFAYCKSAPISVDEGIIQGIIDDVEDANEKRQEFNENSMGRVGIVIANGRYSHAVESDGGEVQIGEYIVPPMPVADVDVIEAGAVMGDESANEGKNKNKKNHRKNGMLASGLFDFNSQLSIYLWSVVGAVFVISVICGAVCYHYRNKIPMIPKFQEYESL